MGKITRFEDLICWQKASKLLNEYEVTEVTKDYAFSKNYALRDQLGEPLYRPCQILLKDFQDFIKKSSFDF